MQPAPNCRRCPRLAALRTRLRREQPDYHNRPVDAWGDASSRILVVGLAPGLHGANRTGRPFTGDSSGDFLFAHLRRYGMVDADGQPKGIRITNAVKCLPPKNRPNASEVARCNPFLAGELSQLVNGIVLSLGRIAHNAILKAMGETQSRWPFEHARCHRIPGCPPLVDSYHCSRYNTQTGRLTDAGFDAVMQQLRPYQE